MHFYPPLFFVKLLTAITVSCLCVLVFACFEIVKLEETSYKKNSDLFEREQLSGKIIHADEVLTMSARMAVATGNLEWETRYLSYEKELDRTIQYAWSFKITGNCLRQTDLAKNKRLEIEKKHCG